MSSTAVCHSSSRARRGAATFAATLLALLVSACAGYGERVASVPLPESRTDHVDVDGARVIAEAYVDPQAAKEALGFDARGAGLLPVRFVVDNQSGKPVRVSPGQTFLIDREDRAWPLLSQEQATDRVKGHVDVGETAKGAGKPALMLGAAGAVAGMAVGVLTGQNVGEAAGKGAVLGGSVGAVGGGAKRHQELNAEIRRDLARHSLENRPIGAGELAYGYLFFPGKDEAGSAARLRLGIEIGDERRVANLPL